jgi:hypothetical protein
MAATSRDDTRTSDHFYGQGFGEFASRHPGLPSISVAVTLLGTHTFCLLELIGCRYAMTDSDWFPSEEGPGYTEELQRHVRRGGRWSNHADHVGR